MKAFLILEDGTVFTGTSIGSTRDMISEIVFNTSMTGYLEVLTDPSYAGQAVVMTYPLIGNYGITPDMESRKAWPDGYIVRELSRMPSNFRCEGTIQDFLKEQDIPGIAGVDTRALTKILREKGTMNGMITTNENYNLEEILPKLKAYTVGDVVSKVTCSEKYVLEGTGKKVALLDLGAKNNIAKSLNQRGCEVTVYPAHTTAEEIISSNPDGIMLSNGPGDPADCTSIIEEIKKLYNTDIRNRTAGTWVYFDHIHIIFSTYDELNIDQTDDMERFCKSSCILCNLVFCFLCQALCRIYRDTVSGMDSCTLNVFHDSRNQNVFAVTNCIDLDFFPL